MFPSPNDLPETNRTTIVRALNAVLADATDLHSQVKTAHWNVRGPFFAPLHQLFDTIAEGLEESIDDTAERTATLGGTAIGTLRRTAATSRIPELPEVFRDRELARLVADRLDAFLTGVRDARRITDGQGDVDTSDLLTGIVQDIEKYGWMLRASIAE